MSEKKDVFSNKIKIWNRFFKIKSKKIKNKVESSPITKKVQSSLSWENIKPHIIKYKEIIVRFTQEQPKTASFIYTCLFCAFSIRFIDKPFALWRIRNAPDSFFDTIVMINPSGWWFFILLFLWLAYMATAGLSLTTDAYERNLIKTRRVGFIFFTLALSSVVCLFLSALTGRYGTELLASEKLYGFVAFRFKTGEMSFPSFASQSIWAVAIATASFHPGLSKVFFTIAGIVTFSLIFTASCFISDAVMGMYIGIMMYFVAKWLLSRERQHPLISL